MLLSERNRIVAVMISGFASGEVDLGFEPRSSQAKDYEIGICFLSTKHSLFRSNSKDCMFGYN